jgi:hypothetical protein
MEVGSEGKKGGHIGESKRESKEGVRKSTCTIGSTENE